LFVFELISTLSDFKRDDAEFEQLKVDLLRKAPILDDKKCAHISFSLNVEQLKAFLYEKDFQMVRKTACFYYQMAKFLYLNFVL
jgi:hypothetical protein